MRLLESILRLAVQLFTFFVELAVRIISGIVGALWSAYQSRAPRHAFQSTLSRTSRPRANNYPRRRHGKGRKSRR